MNTKSAINAVSLNDTYYLRKTLHKDSVHHFFKVKLKSPLSKNEALDYLKARYQKYGEILIETKCVESFDKEIKFVLIEPVYIKNNNRFVV